jgi:hypothetical protein
VSDAAPTQVLSALSPRDVRAHRLEDTWLLTIATLFLAIAIPWLLGSLHIDPDSVALGLLAVGAIYFAFAWLATRAGHGTARRRHSLAALHALAVVMVALVWQHAGGLQNPALLVVFVLPVFGAVFLSRWQPYLVALLAIALVAVLGAAQAPELRWHAAQAGSAAGWVAAVIGKAAVDERPAFASFHAPSAYLVALLEAFAIAMAACAVATEYLGHFLAGLQAQVSASRADSLRSQGLWSSLVEGLPLPALLLDADTREILCASGNAMAAYFPAQQSVVGRDFFEMLSFSYPEPVERLVAGADGVERLSIVLQRDVLRATEVRVQHLAHNGHRLALVLLNDTTESLCLRSALDVAEHATLVADLAGRVLAHNKAARAIFPGAAPGVNLARLLPQADGGPNWWNPGLSGRRKMLVIYARRMYQVTCSVVPLPGKDTRLCVVAVLPAALAAPADGAGASTSAPHQA